MPDDKENAKNYIRKNEGPRTPKNDPADCRAVWRKFDLCRVLCTGSWMQRDPSQNWADSKTAFDFRQQFAMEAPLKVSFIPKKTATTNLPSLAAIRTRLSKSHTIITIFYLKLTTTTSAKIASANRDQCLLFYDHYCRNTGDNRGMVNELVNGRILSTHSVN